MTLTLETLTTVKLFAASLVNFDLDRKNVISKDLYIKCYYFKFEIEKKINNKLMLNGVRFIKAYPVILKDIYSLIEFL